MKTASRTPSETIMSSLSLDLNDSLFHDSVERVQNMVFQCASNALISGLQQRNINIFWRGNFVHHFPACQVRVSRFYQNCFPISSPPPPPPPPSSPSSPPQPWTSTASSRSQRALPDLNSSNVRTYALVGGITRSKIRFFLLEQRLKPCVILCHPFMLVVY